MGPIGVRIPKSGKRSIHSSKVKVGKFLYTTSKPSMLIPVSRGSFAIFSKGVPCSLLVFKNSKVWFILSLSIPNEASTSRCSPKVKGILKSFKVSEETLNLFLL